MRTNQFSIQLYGNIATATATEIGNFLDVLGNLWMLCILKLVVRTTATGVTVFQFVVPWDFELPGDVAAVVEYDKTLDDSLATERQTTIQKPTVTEGDLVVALSDAGLEPELNEYMQIDISEITGVPDLQIWIGFAASSESDFYTPFAAATAYRVFNRAQAQEISKLNFQQAAANTAQKVKAVKGN